MIRSLLFNRYTVTFGAVALLAAFWNLYVSLHDDGIIRGTVVSQDGRPVARATVILSEKTLLVSAPRARTESDSDGRFIFTGHRFYRIHLEAKKDGEGRFPPREYRLCFKGQNMALSEPLRLDKSP